MVFVTEIGRKIRRPGNRVRAIDWLEKGQVATGVVQVAASQGHAVMIMLKLKALIEHISEEGGFDAAILVVEAVLASAILASGIACGRERHHVEERVRMVVFPDLEAVIGVDTRSCGRTEDIRAHAIIIKHERKPRLRTP